MQKGMYEIGYDYMGKSVKKGKEGLKTQIYAQPLTDLKIYFFPQHIFEFIAPSYLPNKKLKCPVLQKFIKKSHLFHSLNSNKRGMKNSFA